MKQKFPALAGAVLILAGTTAPMFAEGSPWLPAPGSGTVTFSYVSQEATDYERSERWRSMAGADSTTIQLAGTLGLDTVWIDRPSLGAARAVDATPTWTFASLAEFAAAIG